jgi:hypothetical protein
MVAQYLSMNKIVVDGTPYANLRDVSLKFLVAGYTYDQSIDALYQKGQLSVLRS